MTLALMHKQTLPAKMKAYRRMGYRSSEKALKIRRQPLPEHKDNDPLEQPARTPIYL
jgi:hypothetical protein